MKNKNIITIIILIVVLVVIIIVLLNQFIFKNLNYSSQSNNTQSSSEHEDYKIVYLYGTNNGITDEQYCIINADSKIVEVRRILTGYTDEELKNQYNIANSNESKFIYSAEINGKSLITTSIVAQNQDIDSYIQVFKLNYKNVSVKKI